MINFPFFNNRSYITLNDFLNNPSGKGAGYTTARYSIIANLESRYMNLLRKNGNRFNFNLYKDRDKYVFIFKIPSESYDGLYYDVVLEFVEDSKDAREVSTINNHSMNFFSNSPNMMFTYTYVLNKENILVDWLIKTRCSKTALKKPPRVRNPIKQFGFEKSCYYAALYIREHKLIRKANLDMNAIPVTKPIKLQLINSIMSQENKLLEYNKFKKQSKKKRK